MFRKKRKTPQRHLADFSDTLAASGPLAAYKSYGKPELHMEECEMLMRSVSEDPELKIQLFVAAAQRGSSLALMMLKNDSFLGEHLQKILNDDLNPARSLRVAQQVLPAVAAMENLSPLSYLQVYQAALFLKASSSDFYICSELSYLEHEAITAALETTKMRLASNASTPQSLLQILVSEDSSGSATRRVGLVALSNPNYVPSGEDGRLTSLALAFYNENPSLKAEPARKRPECASFDKEYSELNQRLLAAQNLNVLLLGQLNTNLPDSMQTLLSEVAVLTLEKLDLYNQVLSGPAAQSTLRVLQMVSGEARGLVRRYEEFTESLVGLAEADSSFEADEKLSSLKGSIEAWSDIKRLESSALLV